MDYYYFWDHSLKTGYFRDQKVTQNMTFWRPKYIVFLAFLYAPPLNIKYSCPTCNPQNTPFYAYDRVMGTRTNTRLHTYICMYVIIHCTSYGALIKHTMCRCCAHVQNMHAKQHVVFWCCTKHDTKTTPFHDTP